MNIKASAQTDYNIKTMTNQEIATTTDKIRWLEILAVAITGAMKFILMDWLEMRGLYIGAACLFWMLFIAKRYKENNEVLRDWGFRKNHFKKTFLFILPFAGVLVAGIIWYGISFNARFLNWHVIPVLLLYPAWGMIQQFMMIGIIAGNLQKIDSLNLDIPQIVLLISLLFALIHYPSVPIMAFAFFMELLFASVYFKWRNLWPLGLYHGWLGSLFLFFVLGRDLWNELWPMF
ncbi:MAG: CPBP family glutamic-type intramembrane protease [Bacteroidota bacterium]